MALDLVVPPRLLGDPTDPLHATRRAYVDRRTQVARPGDDLNAMIAALLPGDTLVVQGTHTVGGGALVAVSGTATKPITIRGDGGVVQAAAGRTGADYAITVTGSYLHFADLIFEEAAKAVVIQGAACQHTRWDRCVGRRTKNEAWKLRQYATYHVFADCLAEDTGLGASFGEGFYVGEAQSNWASSTTPDTTGYIRLERCTTRRTLNDGFDFKEGATNIVARDCSVFHNAGGGPTAGASQGDSGFYNRANQVQFINCQVKGGPADGFKPYDVALNSIDYGRGVEIWGGVADSCAGAGVASQSDDLKVYANFRVVATAGGRTNVVGGGWTSQYDPATFTEQTWTTPAQQYGQPPARHGASHGADGTDPVTPTSIGAQARAVTVRTVTAAYPVVDDDDVVIGNTASAAFTITLPTAVGRAGRTFTVKKPGGTTANPLTISSAGGTIDGQATEIISVAGGFRQLTSDGTNWLIVGGKVEPVIVTPASPANGGTLTLDASVGSVYRVATTVAGFILGAPSNPIDADVINIEITPTVAFALTINAAIVNCTGVASPMSVPANKKLFLGLRTVGTTWYLIAYAIQP